MKINLMLKKLAIAAFALPVMASLPGCNSEDLALGLGAVAVGVAIGGDLDGHHHDRPRCHDGYRRECTSFRDRFGNIHRDCRQVYDPCLRRYALSAAPAELPAAFAGAMVTEATVDAQVAELAQKFDLSFESAETVVTAFNEARKGNDQLIRDLGFDDDDLKRLAQLRMITSQGLDRISTKLDLSIDTTEKMLDSMISQISAQVGDSTSPYWQACLKAAQWKTPENTRCKKASWTGCSPETGATRCLVKAQ